MHLDLFLPGLVWPGESVRELTRGLDLPALSALLGAARVTWEGGQDTDTAMARQFGMTTTPVPFGALRRLGEPIPPASTEAHWLCLDPVNLAFTREHLLLTELPTEGPDAVSMEEAVALCAALRDVFDDIGTLEVLAPTRWYLRLSKPADARFHTLGSVSGRPVALFLPEGEGARGWHTRLNEAQIVLHNHPANQARESRGLRAANSVWPWGNGLLPPSTTASPFDQILADGVLARGLARFLDLTPAAAKAFPASVAGHTLAVVEDLLAPSLTMDIDRWRTTLTDLEGRWLSPLMGAWRAGRIEQLNLHAPGDRRSLRLSLSRRDRWKWWRRPITPDRILLPPALPAAPSQS